MKSAVLLSSLAVAAAGGWFAATLFAAPATSREPRFPPLTMEQLDDSQKPLGEQIMKVSSPNSRPTSGPPAWPRTRLRFMTS